MSELNRPVTPGPWKQDFEDDCAVIWHRAWDVFVWLAEHREQDARAIADLPAWIEAHDDWKARAEKAEAELAEVGDLLQWVVQDFYRCTPSARGQVSVGLAIKAIERHGWGAEDE